MKNILNKNKLMIVLMIALMTVAITACGEKGEKASDEKLQVAVSVVPQATFVEKVAGDLVDIVTIVPPGSSPANYQPTPQEMIELEDSSLYFAIGVAAEATNIMPNMVQDSDVKVVELQSAVSELYQDRYFGMSEGDEHESEHKDENKDEHENEYKDENKDKDEHEGHDHGEGTRDPHIWLSPKRVIVMVETIRDELSELDPDNKNIYADNAASFIGELENLDKEITDMFAEEEDLSFIITHPAVGYFADEYGLHMTSLEKDGKSATAAWMQEMIDFALEEDIHLVFYQAEFDSTQADTLADAIDGKAIQIAPLSPDYISNLKTMAVAFLQNEE